MFVSAELGEEVLRVVPDVGKERRASGLVRRRAVVRDEAGRTQDSLHGGGAARRPRVAQRRRHTTQVRRRRQVRQPGGGDVFTHGLSVCLCVKLRADFHGIFVVSRLRNREELAKFWSVFLPFY